MDVRIDDVGNLDVGLPGFLDEPRFIARNNIHGHGFGEGAAPEEI
jgi:hypothetical protein